MWKCFIKTAGLYLHTHRGPLLLLISKLSPRLFHFHLFILALNYLPFNVCRCFRNFRQGASSHPWVTTPYLAQDCGSLYVRVVFIIVFTGLILNRAECYQSPLDAEGEDQWPFLPLTTFENYCSGWRKQGAREAHWPLTPDIWLLVFQRSYVPSQGFCFSPRTDLCSWEKGSEVRSIWEWLCLSLHSTGSPWPRSGLWTKNALVNLWFMTRNLLFWGNKENGSSQGSFGGLHNLPGSRTWAFTGVLGPGDKPEGERKRFLACAVQQSIGEGALVQESRNMDSGPGSTTDSVMLGKSPPLSETQSVT